jgi:hypothetical protein
MMAGAGSARNGGVRMALVFDRGLVMYLYPAELLRFGASHGLAEREAVTAEHYFLCVAADAQGGWWTPLHPTRGQDRAPIAESAKSGHPRWTQGLSWYSSDELWRIPHKAIQRASQLAGDKSTAKAPNRVDAASVPALAAFPRAAEGSGAGTA